MADDRNARVREHAYRLWQQEGEPHGRDRDHWEQAEREIGNEDVTPDEAPAPSSRSEMATAAPPGGGTRTAPEAAAPKPSTTKRAAAKTPTDKDAAAKKPAARRKRTD